MLQDIYRIEFHGPLFHAGKNFGNKVEVTRVPGLQIQYDDSSKRFKITYKNPSSPTPRTAYVPEINAFLYELVGGQEAAPVNEHVTHDVTKVAGAQVETPMGHVFEGQGKGKTGLKK